MDIGKHFRAAGILSTLMLWGCALPASDAPVWQPTASANAPFDAATLQCRQQAEDSTAALRKDLTASLNIKQSQCQRSLKLSADSKTTYVDNGLGGLMLIDDDYIANHCTPTRQDLAKLEAQVAREQDELLTQCMQSKGYQR
ncbi:MAG: hypothetical protein O2851_08505 [Proteobacteria bacterium]|nr:hypothetical protein [Pseudomonadota bacterium]